MITTIVPSFSIPDAVLEVVSRLKGKGFPTYVVGGALRDALLGKERHDWDVATSASCKSILQSFQKVIPTGIRHGTLGVVSGGQIIEVTTFRGDGIIEDLRHRDFTINALAYDPLETRLIDPFGGISDLQAQVVRAVEDPSARFGEDPLRILRAIRIASELDFRIHRETWRGLRGLVSELQAVAPERIRVELTKSLMTYIPSKPFRWMRQSGILRVLIPELMSGHRIPERGARHRHTVFERALRTLDYLPPKYVLRWAGLLHEVGKPRIRTKVRGSWRFFGHAVASTRLAEEILERLRFSRKETREIVHLIRHHHLRYTARWPDAAVRRLVQRVGPPCVDDLLALRQANRLALGVASTEVAGLKELAARLQNMQKAQGGVVGAKPTLTGRDVMKILGIPPGPMVGKIMKALQQRVTERPSANGRDDLIEWLRERYIPTVSVSFQGHGVH